MKMISAGLPEATDYFGVIRTLMDIRDCIVVEHGAPGTITYTQLSVHAMNRGRVHGRVFSSGVDENDIVLGSDTRLADAVRWVDRNNHPAAIAVVATAITAVIGLDVEGFCRKMQPEISARLIPFASGGFRGTYLSGIEEGSMAVMSSFLGATNERSHDAAPSVNIIGPAKEAFNSVSDTAEIRRLLTCMGVGVNMVFPMDCTTQDIVSVPSANLNIVTRDVMLPVGKYIRESCGLEYITGLPMGIRGTMRWVRTVSEKLGIGYPDALVDHEIAAWAFALPELFSRIQTYEHFSAVISAPYEYASGLAGLVAEDWELRVPAVILPEEPKTPDYMDNFKKLGVSDVFINPSDREFSGIIRAASPQIVFGNSYHLKMAQSVPVRIPAASPTPDIITLFDGTPYVGFRGYAYLTQLLVNEAAKHKEVFTQ